MRTLKFKGRSTNAFFTAVNQIFGGSSQLTTTAEHCFVVWIVHSDLITARSAVVGSCEEPPNIWLTVAKNAFVGWAFNFRVRMSLKGAVTFAFNTLIAVSNLTFLSRFFVESLLNVSLTISSLFHSHLEYLPGLQPSAFSKQVRKRFKITQRFPVLLGSIYRIMCFSSVLKPWPRCQQR